MTNDANLVTMKELHGGVETTPGVEHRVVEIDGGPVSYYEAGSRERGTVLLLHGAMCDEARFSWHQLFPVLAEEFHVVAVDTPRHGKSRPWTGTLSRVRLLAILEEPVDRLGLPKFSIVGLSMGGGLAIEFAAGHPERMTSAVLFEPGGLADRLDKQFVTWLYVKTPGLSRLIGRKYSRASRPELLKLLEQLYVGGSKPTDPERLLDILREEIQAKVRYRERDLDDWQIEAIGPTRTWNLLDRIPKITCPTLWLRGADSEMVKQDEMERAVAIAREAGADVTFTVIPGAGHMLPLERPAEANDAVMEFLRRVMR